jgi:hypothetical protein
MVMVRFTQRAGCLLAHFENECVHFGVGPSYEELACWHIAEAKVAEELPLWGWEWAP